MNPNPATPTRIVPHDQGETHAVMGDAMRFIMTAAHTGGNYAFSEIEVKPGSGAPPHIHHHEEEAFYVLEGRFIVTAEGRDIPLNPGDFAHVPRGAVRAYRNVADRPGRLLILHCPGAAAGFYIGMGKPAYPPRLDDLAALGRQFGIELVRPER